MENYQHKYVRWNLPFMDETMVAITVISILAEKYFTTNANKWEDKEKNAKSWLRLKKSLFKNHKACKRKHLTKPISAQFESANAIASYPDGQKNTFSCLKHATFTKDKL